MDVIDIEVAEDRTERSTCQGGFLKLRRLMLRNVYADGTRSAPYACDVMSRTQVDAVAVVLYEIDGARRVKVMLKEGFRPPVVLRRDKAIEHREPRPLMKILEIAAGVLEAKDAGPDGIESRAADEAHEECGMAVDPAQVVRLGEPSFPSPGVTDERVHFRAVPVDVTAAGRAHGDGSPMEHGTAAVVLDLEDAISMCRGGAIPDMKTEIALLRLADAIAWIPQLRCFRDELPPELAVRWTSCGLPEREGA
jgi:ADP-ribose pyrophosphatase